MQNTECNPGPESPFTLDIRLLESSDSLAQLINLTDDGCGASCPTTCVTSTSA
ncbi:FxLD family lanthipeptide [Nocardiopsis sp. N85]|uniref:FxLD family lanthipeptide n=1 Tax=Nocardiopsis sp. N85 TaxID=3029400 RepID=UPI00237FC6A9|nr:FxLD family lanthipeptide [Nocardiopsis sp. N85]MDE3721424.1 FxLD family lanthipeptide [Nocardiopsis sp. N85]